MTGITLHPSWGFQPDGRHHWQYPIGPVTYPNPKGIQSRPTPTALATPNPRVFHQLIGDEHAGPMPAMRVGALRG